VATRRCRNRSSDLEEDDDDDDDGYFLWGKGGGCVGLTTLPTSCADCHTIWEPLPTGTLRACPGLYRVSFTLLVYLLRVIILNKRGNEL